MKLTNLQRVFLANLLDLPENKYKPSLMVRVGKLVISLRDIEFPEGEFNLKEYNDSHPDTVDFDLHKDVLEYLNKNLDLFEIPNGYNFIWLPILEQLDIAKE